MTKPENRSSGELRLDAGIDALFRAASVSTPSPPSATADDAGWDDADWAERADAIVAIARARSPSTDDAALFAPPPLAAEPDEPAGGDHASPPSGETPRALPMQGSTDRNGRTMSDETPKPPSSRRPSLKELAESVKNRPSLPSSSGVSSQRPPPASLKDTLVAMEGKIPAPPPASSSSGRGSMPSAPGMAGPVSTPPVSAPTSTPPVSGPHSGLAAATPVPSSVVPVSASVTGPTSGVPVSAVPSSSALAGPSTKPSPGVSKPGKGSNVGVGIGIGALGLAAAAAFALWTQSRPIDAPVAPTVAAVETAAPAVADSPPAPAATGAEPSTGPEPGVIDISQLADADAAASAAPAVGGPLPTGPAPAGSAVAKNDPAKPAGPTGPGEELGEAIRNRAGGGSDTPEDAEPAAGEPSRKNVPNVPPTGAVTSAINAVKGNAKGCVAGADAPSSATITFSSSGAVQGVSVGGWAQGKSAAACIKSALSGARVPPFANPSYATSVTIRP